MPTISSFRNLALSFEEAVELPHFDRASFRIRKKIFATLDEKNNHAVLLLSEIDQSVFCSFDKNIIYPVPNKWGKHGATIVELEKVGEEMLLDALTTAYCGKAPKNLADKYQPK